MTSNFIVDPATITQPKPNTDNFVADPATVTPPEPFKAHAPWNFYGKKVNFADVQKSTKLELMANAGAYSSVKAIGTAAAMTGNPLGLILAGAAYLGSEAFAFTKSATMARDENVFWTDYFNKVNEVVAEKGTMGDMLAGFTQGTSLFTGTSTPEEVKEVTDSGAFLAGDLVGMLTRDFTMMAIGSGTVKALGGAVSKARLGVENARAAVTVAETGVEGTKASATSLEVLSKAQQGLMQAETALAQTMQSAAVTGSNMGFVAGSSISNALNTATDSYAYDGGVINAMRNGLAHGAATGLTGYFFLNNFAGAMKKAMPKLLDTTIGASLKNGIEFSAWGLGEEVLNTTIVNGLGGDKDFNIDPVTYAAMFGLGAVGTAIFRSGKGSKMIREISDEVFDDVVKEAIPKATKNILAKTVESNLTAKRILKNEIKSMVRVDNYSLLSPEEIRFLANNIVAQGKATSRSYKEILIEKMTNDSRYANMSGDDIDHISKMVFERFVK